jgi:hypothetical protein
MDFEDYLLAGVGTAGGLALGSKVVGNKLGNKWGEQGYYESKARSLGTRSDANVDYENATRQVAISNLPDKLKLREIQKLQLQRQRVVGKSVLNTKRDAENNRGWNRSKGIVAGTVGTGLLGGAVGLEYGLNNDFNKTTKNMTKFSRKRDSTYARFCAGYTQAVANFSLIEENSGRDTLIGIGSGALAGSEIGRAMGSQTIARGLRKSADPNSRHNLELARKLAEAEQVQDPNLKAKLIRNAQSEADYKSARIQSVSGLLGGAQRVGGGVLGAGTGLLGATIGHTNFE